MAKNINEIIQKLPDERRQKIEQRTQELMIEIMAEKDNQKLEKIRGYFNVLIEKNTDGHLVASVPALKGCHTQAKTYDELMEKIQETIELCLETEDQDFEPLEFIGVQRIPINP